MPDMPEEQRSALLEGLRQTSFVSVLALCAAGGYLISQYDKDIESLKHQAAAQKDMQVSERVTRLEIEVKNLNDKIDRIERNLDKRLDRLER